MNAEDQVRNLKQIPLLSKEERRKKIMTSIVLTMATIISIAFLLYAFQQKLEAEKQTAIAIEAKDVAEKQKALALEALAACEKSKK